MKPRFFFLSLGLLALTMLSACASATSAPTVSLPTNTATAVLPSPSAEMVATSTVPPTPIQAVATSRGPDLEATDPSMVILASGQLQLVEFFRFT